MNTDRRFLIGGLLMIVSLLMPIKSGGQSTPEKLMLDSLVQNYEGVSFDHAKHVGLSKDCAVCHHHTTGTSVENANCVRCHKNSGATVVASCRGCHAAQPFSAETIKANRQNPLTYHRDKIGLRGAYHQSCRGCHVEVGGPTGCQDCHPRKKVGDVLFRSAK